MKRQCNGFSLLILCAFMLMSTAASAQSLTTTFSSNNGFNANMFDTVAKKQLTVTGFDANLASGAHDVSIYYRTGTHEGFEDSSAGWTLLGTVTVNSTGTDSPTVIPLALNVAMPPNARFGWYITTDSTSMRYTTGTTLGDVYVEDSNLQIMEGAGCASDFSSCFSPRVWNGTIRYSSNQDPPSIATIADQTTLEEQSHAVTMVLSDPDTPANQLTATATSSNQAVLTTNNITITGSGAQRTLTMVPTTDAVGQTTVTISVSDGVQSTQESFILSVLPVNDAPNFTVGQQVQVQEDSAAASLTNWATSIVMGPADEQTQSVSFQVSNDNMALFLVQPTLSETGTLTFTPAPNAHGTAQLSVVLIDDGGTANGGQDRTAAKTASIVITPVNDSPVAQSTMVTTMEDVAVDIALSAQDIDGDMLTYIVDTPPTHGTLTGQGATRTYTPDANFNGMDVFQFHVDDGQASSAVVDVQILVSAVNDAPIFIAPTPDDGATLTAQEGQTLSIVLAAQDIDGDVVTYSVRNAPAGATFSQSNATLSWTPNYSDAGPHSLILEATDGALQITRPITIVVSFIDGDMDGVPDTWENQNGLDSTTADSDMDTISDLDEVGDITMPRDSDDDKVFDALDNDSDNDNIPDIDEAGDVDLTTPPVDSDRDGIPDYRDTDSDDDTVLDTTDNCRGIKNLDQKDLDTDGQGDVCDDDIDGDGLLNLDEVDLMLDPLDPDSDDDTISDGDEVGDPAMAFDTNNDQILDAQQLDSDDDGISDAMEAGDTMLNTPPIDTDKDGLPDYRDTDSDNDTINDKVDNCRLVFNTDQKDTTQNGTGDACDGDIDGDGLLNDMDNCPMIKNEQQEDLDGDKKGDVCDDDRDGDTVLNDMDNCPSDANMDQSDLDRDTTGDVCDGDQDGDDLLNDMDNCPKLANTNQLDMDEDGLGDVCDDDRDGDDITNDNDACPDTPGQQANGCPEETPDMGTDMTQMDMGTSPPPARDIDSGVSGCGCSSTRVPPLGAWTLLIFGLILMRVRRWSEV